VAGQPAASYFAAVLISEYRATTNGIGSDPDCVSYADHLEDQSLSSEEQSSITTWITGGALNN
jgi:hypothetical protein